MRSQTKALLAHAHVEKDVENAYRGEIAHERKDVVMTSPHGGDGYAQWGTVRALLEFKLDKQLKSRADQIGVLSQMVKYLKKFEAAGDAKGMPNVLFVGDKNECFVLETAAVQKFLSLPIDWTVAPSTLSPDLTSAMVAGLDVSPFVYDVPDCDFREVLSKVEALAKGEVHRIRASPSNIGAMFINFADNILVKGSGLTAVEQVDVFLRCLFKPSEAFTHPTNHNLLLVDNRKVPIHGHVWQSFIEHFVRGYKPSEVEAFYANKDRLVEDDARRRQGAFFTPTLWVDEAHKMLDAELGADWRDKCIVWDPAAGTGNLTRDYRFTDLIISTAEKPDCDVIKEQGYNPGASVFAYDFLNDDSSPFFEGKNVIPDAVDERLRAAVKAGKRLVFFMNPPYGTANNAGTVEGDSKAGIALTSVNADMKRVKIGGASQQLYAQFMYRCTRLAETYGFAKTTVATFSVPTFMCSGSYKGFRDFWYKRFAYKAGMLFQASHFADVSGRWGISFTVWSEGRQDSKVTVPVALKDVHDFTVVQTADKAFYNSDGVEASEWVGEPTKDLQGISRPQFSSGLKVAATKYSDRITSGSLALFDNASNSVTYNGVRVGLYSGAFSNGGGVGVTPGESFRRATALYAARKLVTEDWMNQKDEYIRPTDDTPAYKQWNDDAIVYALLHPSNNCTAMRGVQYKGKQYRIKNHFWHLTRQQSKVLYDQPNCTALYADLRAEQEDAYLATILPTLDLSAEARECLALYDKLLTETLPHREAFATAKPELHLMAHDAGLYQTKHLFRAHSPDGYKLLQAAFKALADKLRPGVYTHGFLRA